LLTERNAVGPANVETAGLAAVEAARRHVRQIKVALQPTESPLRSRIRRLALDKELVECGSARVYGGAAVTVGPHVEAPVVVLSGGSGGETRLESAALANVALQSQSKPGTACSVIVGAARSCVAPVLGIEMDAEVSADIPDIRFGAQCGGRHGSGCQKSACNAGLKSLHRNRRAGKSAKRLLHFHGVFVTYRYRTLSGTRSSAKLLVANPWLD